MDRTAISGPSKIMYTEPDSYRPRCLSFEVYDIRDHGLRGQADEAILSFATQKKALLITGDLGFGNQLKYPVGSNGELLPHTSRTDLSEDELKLSLTILEPGKIRSRKN